MTEYDKLVRDRIPEIVRENGETPITHEADGEEYARRLREKLVEEAEEYAEAGDPAELADVLEVIDAVRALDGVDPERVRELREAKAAERGRFDEGVVLDRVER